MGIDVAKVLSQDIISRSRARGLKDSWLFLQKRDIVLDIRLIQRQVVEIEP